MKVCISIPLKNRLQITISVITVLFWPNITLLKCKYRKVYINIYNYIYLYINICSNRLLLPSNPYTPSGKNCNNWNCNYRNIQVSQVSPTRPEPTVTGRRERAEALKTESPRCYTHRGLFLHIFYLKICPNIQNSLKWAIYECFTSIEVMIWQ